MHHSTGDLLHSDIAVGLNSVYFEQNHIVLAFGPAIETMTAKFFTDFFKVSIVRNGLINAGGDAFFGIERYDFIQHPVQIFHLIPEDQGMI
jgi:hypothetical protein